MPLPVHPPRWKRALDLTCVMASAPVWLPLGLAIAAFIKLVSRGKVLFKQERIGFLEKPFTCLKFRTMTSDAEADVHASHLKELISSNRPMIKLDTAGDGRLIPGGLLLRTLGLDELPQILNIIRGEMSLVGPRPCIPYEYAQYRPDQRRRFLTLPGLTGLWQVSGKNRTTFEEMVGLDIKYAETKTLLLDLKIMALTPPAILGQTRDLKRSRTTTRRHHLVGTGIGETG